MRLLVDQNLPRRLVALLLAAAHEAAHTEDEGLATATDPVILSWCCTHDRALVTADKKMTKFFAGSGSTCPTVLVVRDLRTLAVERIAAMLLANLEQIEEFVNDHGNALFSIMPDKPIRAQLLPIGPIGPIGPAG